MNKVTGARAQMKTRKSLTQWHQGASPTNIHGSAKRIAAFTLQHGAMPTPQQPEGCVPVVVSIAHDATIQLKTSDTPVTVRLFSVSHETDAEGVAVWLDHTIAVNNPFKIASTSSSRGNEAHFS